MLLTWLQAREATVQLPCALTMQMGYHGSKQEPDVQERKSFGIGCWLTELFREAPAFASAGPMRRLPWIYAS